MLAVRADLPDWLLSQPIAHRGLHDNASDIPENSLTAIKACVLAQCPVEIDIRQLADGCLAVFHDRTVDRMTRQCGVVAQFCAADLKDLTLLRTDESIPLLAEVLATVSGAVPLLIEIKCESPSARHMAALVFQELSGYSGPYAVQSFNPFVLRHMRRLDTEVPLGLLSGWRFGVSIARFAGANVLCQEVRGLDDASVQRARRNGLPVLAWVIRNHQTLRKAALLADNYIFEDGMNSAALD